MGLVAPTKSETTDAKASVTSSTVFSVSRSGSPRVPVTKTLIKLLISSRVSSSKTSNVLTISITLATTSSTLRSPVAPAISSKVTPA